MAMAERIAETDRFTLTMTKLAVNQAQDAMGFSTTIKNALRIGPTNMFVTSRFLSVLQAPGGLFY